MKKLITFLCLALLPVSAFAGRYIVASDGDQTSLANCEWTNYPSAYSGNSCTWQTGVQNADDDDIVYFRGGTYTLTDGDFSSYDSPAMNPSNSGSSGHPITFIAYPGEVPYIYNNGSGDDQDSACNYPVIGANAKNYIVWDGFKTGGRYNGKAVAWNCNNITFQNCEIVGTTWNTGCPGNYDGIRVEDASYITIDNCYIHGQNCGATDHGNGYKCYDSDNITVTRSTFDGQDAGILSKQGCTYETFSYNLMLGNSDAGYTGINAGNFGGSGAAGTPNNTTIHNNIVVNSHSNLQFSGIYVGCDNDSGATTASVYNNTVITNDLDPSGAAIFHRYYDNVSFWNNMVINSDTNEPNYSFRIADEQPLYFDYNWYNGSTLWASDDTEYTSLSSWRASGEVEGGGNPDASPSSNTGDPVFADDSDSVYESTDYRLTASSPAGIKTGGRGGAYASYIGAWNPSAEMWVGYCAAGIGGCDVYGDTSVSGSTSRTVTGLSLTGATIH